MSIKINREGQLEFKELLRNKRKEQRSLKPIERSIHTEDLSLIARNEIASSYYFPHNFFACVFFKIIRPIMTIFFLTNDCQW